MLGENNLLVKTAKERRILRLRECKRMLCHQSRFKINAQGSPTG